MNHESAPLPEQVAWQRFIAAVESFSEDTRSWIIEPTLNNPMRMLVRFTDTLEQLGHDEDDITFYSIQYSAFPEGRGRRPAQLYDLYASSEDTSIEMLHPAGDIIAKLEPNEVHEWLDSLDLMRDIGVLVPADQVQNSL